jgi:hypothetical protein
VGIEHAFRQSVEAAGGHFLGVCDGVVHFAAAPGQKELTLYAFSCTRENVSLSLKAFRENLAHDAWETLI